MSWFDAVTKGIAVANSRDKLCCNHLKHWASEACGALEPSHCSLYEPADFLWKKWFNSSASIAINSYCSRGCTASVRDMSPEGGAPTSFLGT